MSFDYYEPTSLVDALAALEREGEDGAALAGGTDLLLRIRRGVRQYRSVVNLKRVPGLKGISWGPGGDLSFGALTTFRAIEIEPRVVATFPALVEGARVLAGVQLRNLATVGGNLANASPAADSLPPLVALDATITIASHGGERTIPVQDCVSGPGRSVLEPGEVFTHVQIPGPAPSSGNAYTRFSPRSAMDIGIASVAASINLGEEGQCASVRIALGAVSPTPLRAEAAEALLVDQRPDERLFARAGELAAQAAQPITDIRGSAEYRRAIVGVLTGRMLQLAAARAAASRDGSPVEV